MSTNNSNNNNVDVEKAVVLEKAAPLEQAPTSVPVTAPAQKKRLLIALTTIVLLVALAIGLGVGLSSSSSSSSNKNSAPQVQDSSSLEVLCRNQNDLDECRMSCEEYMCCFHSNEEECDIPSNTCGTYAPCFVLVNDEQVNEPADEQDENDNENGGGNSLPGGPPVDGATSLSEPTEEVREICNSGYLEVSNITCEEACWEANCCYWTGDDSCYEEHAQVCEMWRDAGCFAFSDPFGGEEATLPGAGQVLEDGEVLEEPDSNVEIICSSDTYTSQGGITCEEACNKAACCYWVGEDSCYDDNVDVCEMWNDAGCFSFSDPQNEQDDP